MVKHSLINTVFISFAAPLFIFQWQSDKFQMYADNVPVPSSKDQWDYVRSMSNNLRSTFNALSTVFSPACIAHEVLLGQDWTTVEVDGVTLPDALECWTSSLPSVAPEDFTSLDEMVFSSMVRSQIKTDGIDNFHSINSKSPSMLADAPRTAYDFKLNRNLLRKMATPTELAELAAEKSRNSISNRASKPIRKRHRNVINNRTDRRRLSTNKVIEREQRRRKWKRLQRQLQKCRVGDEDACEKLRKHHGIEMFENDPLNGGEGKGKLRQNSDLVRSLDRRSSRKGRNRDKTSPSDRRKRKTARQRNLEKRRAKRLRKQKRKQQRRERKRKQREKLRKRRKQKIRRRQKENKAKEEAVDRNISQDVKINVPLSAVNDGKHHLKVRSVEQEQSFMSIPKKSAPKKSSQGQCRTKLIDNCSWPHCNRSCPKLKNPKTGKYHLIKKLCLCFT